MMDTIVLYPSPGKGHLASMVQFGVHLLTHHRHSFSVTVITTVPAPSLAASNPDLAFHLLPDIDGAASPGPPSNLIRLHNPNLRLALQSIPNVKALVADFFCCAAVEVAHELHIPFYFYFTSGANGLTLFLNLPTRNKTFPRGLIQLGDQIVTLPGLPPMPASQLPKAMVDRDEKIYDFFVNISDAMIGSAGIIVNTWTDFDQRAVRAIVAGECVPDGDTPPIYCIGPLVSAGDGEGERHECLRWLDSQPRGSVLFLSFGSMGSFSKEQLAEMGVALERSGVRFVWVVRSPAQEKQPLRTIAAAEADLDLESILPEGFMERTRERGYVVNSWAPQVAVLSHEAVGGFVTHCGWNSILEAVWAGVPMLAWPLYAEQTVNRAFLVEEARAALTVAESGDGFVRADELEERVTELMNSDKGMAVRERVKALRESAMGVLTEGGSSRLALAHLADSFKRV